MLEVLGRAVGGECNVRRSCDSSTPKRLLAERGHFWERDALFSIGSGYTLECILTLGIGRVGEAAISDPTTDRLPGAVMTVILASALHIVVTRRYGTPPEKLNAALSTTTTKRLKAVVIRGSVKEETQKP